MATPMPPSSLASAQPSAADGLRACDVGRLLVELAAGSGRGCSNLVLGAAPKTLLDESKQTPRALNNPCRMIESPSWMCLIDGPPAISSGLHCTHSQCSIRWNHAGCSQRLQSARQAPRRQNVTVVTSTSVSAVARVEPKTPDVPDERPNTLQARPGGNRGHPERASFRLCRQTSKTFALLDKPAVAHVGYT